MGGCVPLGYEVKERKLLINEEEAKLVKFIYKEFIENESYCNVAHQLNMLGHRTRLRQMKNGKTVGGQMFEPKAIERILKCA